MKVLAGAIAVLALVVIAGAAVWFAAERHYEACIREAEAAHPITTTEEVPERSSKNLFDEIYGGQSEETTTEVVGAEERQAAIDACSRWPF